MSCYLCGDLERPTQPRAVGTRASVSVCLPCAKRWKLKGLQERIEEQLRELEVTPTQPTFAYAAGGYEL